MFVHPNHYTSESAPRTCSFIMPMTMHVCHSDDTLPGSASANMSEKEV